MADFKGEMRIRTPIYLPEIRALDGAYYRAYRQVSFTTVSEFSLESAGVKYA
jgi:hypothetical protein